MKTFLTIIAYIFTLIFLLSHQVSARIPYLTFDPEPIAYEHVEVQAYTAFDQRSASATLQGPGIVGKWGALPNLGLYARAAIDTYIPLSSRAGRTTHTGPRDIFLGAKYRFFNEEGFQAAFFPMVDLPTGNAKLRLGNGKAWVRLPLWFQKKWDSWKVDIGGGYALNSASGRRNHFFGGGKIRYKFTQDLTLGVEVFHQEQESFRTQRLTVLNAGGEYFVTKNVKIVFSAGHSIVGEKRLLGCFGIGWEG